MAAAVAAVVVAGALAIVASRQSSDSRPAPEPTWSWLSAVPAARAAVGPIRLDGSIAEVTARLGPPDVIGPDIVGVSRSWYLPGGAQLSVTAPVGADETVVGIVAVVPAGSEVRVGLYRGVMLGDATIAEVVRAWGPPERLGMPGADYDIQYVECRGVLPIVIKFESNAEFDRVLVAYADEAPGSAGCEVLRRV